MLSQENPYLTNLGDPAFKQLSSLEPGSCIFVFRPTEKDPEPDCEMIFCGWKGKMSVRSFVSKHARSHYLRLCGVELEDIQKTAAAKKSKEEEKEEDKIVDGCMKVDSESEEAEGEVEGEDDDDDSSKDEEAAKKAEDC